MRGRRRKKWLALGAVILGLATASTAWAAFQALPVNDSQVNADPASGIDGTLSVGGEDPTNADVVGGALTAGNPAVPWAIFRQQTSGGGHDQVFVRAFAGGAWSTKGIGTVGGKSSASPTFPGSLNFDQGRTARRRRSTSPARAGRSRGRPGTRARRRFNANQIFASRFDNSGDANQGKWLFAGQSRGNGTGTVPVPSLNIHTAQNAENPSVAGGSAADPTKPGPWVTWQEAGAPRPAPARIRSSSTSRSARARQLHGREARRGRSERRRRSAASAGSRSASSGSARPIRR